MWGAVSHFLSFALGTIAGVTLICLLPVSYTHLEIPSFETMMDAVGELEKEIHAL